MKKFRVIEEGRLNDFKITNFQKLLCMLCLLFGATAVIGQTHVYTDPRHELSCIAWRLAGCEEYNGTLFKPYAEDIDAHFVKYKDHPLMDFIRRMREEPYLVAYNAVPEAAELMTFRKGRIRLDRHRDIAIFVSDFDGRWTKEHLEEYAALLDDFSRVSGFERFYNDHRALYERYEKGMERLLTEIQPQWFESFFGEPFPELSVCISPACGTNNYALLQSFTSYLGKPGIGAIIGGFFPPENPDHTFPVLLHEIMHSFTNPIVAQYAVQMDPFAVRIFPYVESPLTEAGYGAPEIVMSEFFNELFTILYLRDREDESLSNHIRLDGRKGFIWMPSAIVFMDNFFRNRSMFPFVGDFMPQLVGYLSMVADHIEPIRKEFYDPPFVVSVFPAPGATITPELTEVRVRFSRPMDTGLVASGLPKTEGVEPFTLGWDDDDVEEEEAVSWIDDRTMSIKVQVPLRHGKSYGILLPALYTRRADNWGSMENDYEVYFKVESK